MTITRRALLRGTVLSMALAGRAKALEPDRETTWEIGLGLNGFMSSESEFGHVYPLWEVLDFAAAEGFHGIELVEGWPQGGYPSSDEGGRIHALKGHYDRYGLQVYTIQNGGSDAYAADKERRKAWLIQFRDRMRLCKALGCDFIGHWPGGDLAGNATVDEAIAHLAQSYREASAMAADMGLFMSFEIEPPFIFNTLDHLQRILAEVDHPACKTNYDPSHFDLMSGSNGTPHVMLKELGVHHIGHVHLTDSDGTLFGGTSKHLPCGDGHIDMAASLDTLWQGGFHGWIMIDGWMIDDVYRAARQGKAAIDAAQKRNTNPSASVAL